MSKAIKIPFFRSKQKEHNSSFQYISTIQNSSPSLIRPRKSGLVRGEPLLGNNLRVQSYLYSMVIFGTKAKWPGKTGDCLIKTCLNRSFTVGDR